MSASVRVVQGGASARDEQQTARDLVRCLTSDVVPSTKEQRFWVHKTANCLDALPKRLHLQPKPAIQATIYNVSSRAEA
jgi:hypothetical protein